MECQVTGAEVSYRIQGNKVSITGAVVSAACVKIPSQIEGYPVTEIEKKAFLGNKKVKEVYLPDTVEEIGEWAFAHCSNLQKIRISPKTLIRGTGVFKDCMQLKEICFLKQENEQVAALLAAAPVLLDAPYLLTPSEAGKEEWLIKFDARLTDLMAKPDEEGYLRQVLCGEEDLMASLEFYLAERKKYKARLCYLRLMHPIGLKEETGQQLQTWLKEHTKGCASEAAWELLLENQDKGQTMEQIFAKAGCITEENFDALLADMQEKYPEKKAWFLRYRDRNMKKNDFFENMLL